MKHGDDAKKKDTQNQSVERKFESLNENIEKIASPAHVDSTPQINKE